MDSAREKDGATKNVDAADADASSDFRLGMTLLKDGKLRISDALRNSIFQAILGGEPNYEPLRGVLKSAADDIMQGVSKLQAKLKKIQAQIKRKRENGKGEDCKGLLKGFENIDKMVRPKRLYAEKVRAIEPKTLYEFMVRSCKVLIAHVPHDWRTILLNGFMSSDESSDIGRHEDGSKYEEKVLAALRRGCGERFRVDGNVHLTAPGLQQGKKTEFDALITDTRTNTVVAIIEVKRSYVALMHGVGNVPFNVFGEGFKYVRTELRKKQTFKHSTKEGDVTFARRPLILGVAFHVRSKRETILNQMRSEIIAFRSYYPKPGNAQYAREHFRRGGVDLSPLSLFPMPKETGLAAVSSGKRPFSMVELVGVRKDSAGAFETCKSVTIQSKVPAGADGSDRTFVHPVNQLKCGSFAQNFWVPGADACTTDESSHAAAKDIDEDSADDVRHMLETALSKANFVRKPLDVPRDLLENIDFAFFCKTVVNGFASCVSIRSVLKDAAKASMSE
eukprot:g882.t1